MRRMPPLLALVVATHASCTHAPPGGGGLDAGALGTVDVLLEVDTTSSRRAISPLIYGINGDTDNAHDRPTIVRDGGNRLSAYNWENNASNAGSDYCHQNDATFGGPGSLPAGAFRATLLDARTRGTAAIVTVPIGDYVAADHDDLGDAGQGPPACVGDVANSGSDFLSTRFVANHARKGSAFASTPNLGDGAVYQDELVAYLAGNFGDVPVHVSLDNEPDLWSSTHARIHPAPVTYAALAARNLEYAAAVKDAWPSAKTLGFVSYGYSGYVNLQSAPDAAGNGEFLAYYLDAMHAGSQAAGHRLVDFLDVHWYPEARGDGIRITESNDALGAVARVQATRSLWDPEYAEDSWIVNQYLHAPIRLLPWLAETIAAHDAGMGIAITEWNYGGGNHVSGAIATADALGIFGREGVAIATIWQLHGDEPYTRAGLRMFTSYDGAGASFAETSVAANSSDAQRVAIHASQGADGRVVLVIVNKAAVALTAAVHVADAQTFVHAARWVLDGDAPTITQAGSLDASASNAFRVPLPAWSVTVLVPE